jgi:hypothetical protein
MRNIGVFIGVDVPFSSKPVTVTLSFARPDNPFNLSVWALGGSGYVTVQLYSDKLTQFEASMAFGAIVAVNFVIASAEVHALGGVRIFIADDQPGLDAFIRLGGSVEVFGLVSVSIELILMLMYKSGPSRLEGQATLVIDVDLGFFSKSVKLDSGTWTLVGHHERRAMTFELTADRTAEERFAGLVEYYEAFAP